MRFTPQDIDALKTELADTLKLLEQSGHDALRHAIDYHAVGFPGGASDGTPRGSDISDPTAGAVLRLNTAKADTDPDVWKSDPTAGYYTGLRTRCANLRNALADVRQQVNAIEARAASDIDDDGKRRRTVLGAGNCKACDVSRSGVGEDRLRGGLCDSCRKRFERDPARWGHDRVRFARDTRREQAK